MIVTTKKIIYLFLFLSFFISCGSDGSPKNNDVFKILDTKPKNTEKNISLDTDIKITFNKDLSKEKSNYEFSIKDKDNKEVNADIVISDKTLILLNDKLKPSMKYNIIISKVSSSDNKEINSSYIFSFTTISSADNISDNKDKEEDKPKDKEENNNTIQDPNKGDNIQEYGCGLSPGGKCF